MKFLPLLLPFLHIIQLTLAEDVNPVPTAEAPKCLAMQSFYEGTDEEQDPSACVEAAPFLSETSFLGAQQACANGGGSLVQIATKSKLDFVKNLVNEKILHPFFRSKCESAKRSKLKNRRWIDPHGQNVNKTFILSQVEDDPDKSKPYTEPGCYTIDSNGAVARSPCLQTNIFRQAGIGRICEYSIANITSNQNQKHHLRISYYPCGDDPTWCELAAANKSSTAKNQKETPSICYKLERFRATYDAGRCDQYDAELVSIHDDRQLKMIVKMAQLIKSPIGWLGQFASPTPWIGLHKRTSDGSISWSDGTQIDYLMSGGDQIDGADQDGLCYVLKVKDNDGFVQRQRCDHQHPAVCRRCAGGGHQCYQYALNLDNDPDKKVKTCESDNEILWGNYCYQLHEEEKTYKEAKQTCDDGANQLVAINSYYEQAFVASLTWNLTSWIGLQIDIPRKRHPEWLDQSPFSYYGGDGPILHSADHRAIVLGSQNGQTCATLDASPTGRGVWHLHIDTNADEARALNVATDETCTEDSEIEHPFVCRRPAKVTEENFRFEYSPRESEWRGNTYEIHFEQKSQEEAQSSCEANGLGLLVVSDIYEWYHILAQLKNATTIHTQFWLGLQFNKDYNAFVTLGDPPNFLPRFTKWSQRSGKSSTLPQVSDLTENHGITLDFNDHGNALDQSNFKVLNSLLPAPYICANKTKESGQVKAQGECQRALNLTGSVNEKVLHTTAGCYYFFDDEMVSGYRLDTACRKKGLHSAAITTSQISENITNFVHSQFNNDQKGSVLSTSRQRLVYIGLKHMHGDVWAWSNVTAPLNYLNWANGEPRLTESHDYCAAMHINTGRWEALVCYESKYYLCYAPYKPFEAEAETTGATTTAATAPADDGEETQASKADQAPTQESEPETTAVESEKTDTTEPEKKDDSLSGVTGGEIIRQQLGHADDGLDIEGHQEEGGGAGAVIVTILLVVVAGVALTVGMFFVKRRRATAARRQQAFMQFDVFDDGADNQGAAYSDDTFDNNS